MNPFFKVYHTLSEVSDPYRGIILDAYGVFWGGGIGLLPGAKEAMETLVSRGHIIGILSNTSQPAQKEITKWRNHGLELGKHFHFAVTSREILDQLVHTGNFPFPTPNKKFWLYGSPHPLYVSPLEVFRNSPFSHTPIIEEADFIYIAIPHINGTDQTDPEIFRQDIKKLKDSGLPMLCANPDRFAQEGKPPKAVVRQGSIGALYEEYGGTVIYIGKPAPLSFETTMTYFEKYGIFDPKQVLMVGDTPETDIRGARLSGMKSALIVGTGILAYKIAEIGLDKIIETLPLHDRPDFYVYSLGEDYVI